MDNEIRSLHLDPTVAGQPIQAITGLEGVRGVDFDYEDHMLYFSQYTSKKLTRFNINTRSQTDFVVNANATGWCHTGVYLLHILYTRQAYICYIYYTPDKYIYDTYTIHQTSIYMLHILYTKHLFSDI